MDWIRLYTATCACISLTIIGALTLKALTQSLLPFSIPDSWILILCFTYSVIVYLPELRAANPNLSKSIPKTVDPELARGLAEAKKELDTSEELLQTYGSLIEESGIFCRDTFAQIHKDQKEQLKQYHDFRKQYSEQFGSIVNVLEGHRKGIAETSRVAGEQNASLCNIIGQYRQMVEDNQKFVRTHIDSVTETLNTQEKAITRNQELADERNESIQSALQTQSRLIEDNTKLIRKHGTSIDNVVSDHANLVGEYQKALDGLALLITANRIFSSIHEASAWENLKDHTRQFDIESCLVGGAPELTQARATFIKGLESGVASASAVGNAQQVALKFRGSGRDGRNARAVFDMSGGTGQRGWLFGQKNNNNMKAEYPGWAPVSRMEQLMATMFDQLKATLQNTVEARHAEETRQLRQGREDMEKLRAEIGDIQELRQQVREAQARRETMDQQEAEIKALHEEIRRLRDELPQHVREEIDQHLAEVGNAATATNNLIASTDDSTLAGATITDPTEVTYPSPIPTAEPTNNDDAGAVDASDHGVDNAVDDATDDDTDGPGEGRLLGEFLGRMLAREDWPAKKRSRRKTRKMYAMAKQRAEQQAKE